LVALIVSRVRLHSLLALLVVAFVVGFFELLTSPTGAAVLKSKGMDPAKARFSLQWGYREGKRFTVA
jgi:hypothetical protein